MEKNRAISHMSRHTLVQYALLAQPRPGNRETRMRETAGSWLQRNGHDNQRGEQMEEIK